MGTLAAAGTSNSKTATEPPDASPSSRNRTANCPILTSLVGLVAMRTPPPRPRLHAASRPAGPASAQGRRAGGPEAHQGRRAHPAVAHGGVHLLGGAGGRHRRLRAGGQQLHPKARGRERVPRGGGAAGDVLDGAERDPRAGGEAGRRAGPRIKRGGESPARDFVETPFL